MRDMSTSEKTSTKSRRSKLLEQDPRLFATPTVLEPDAGEWQIVKEQQGRRLTPEAKAFIIKMILQGHPNRTINERLRYHKYLSPSSPDLSHDTFTRLRRLKEAQMSVDLLTEEARAVVHGSLSELIVNYRHLYSLCMARLSGEPYGGTGLIFDKATTASELRSIMADATKFLTAFHAKYIHSYLGAVSEEAKSASYDDNSQFEAMERTMVAYLTQRIMKETRRLEAAGVVIPPNVIVSQTGGQTE